MTVTMATVTQPLQKPSWQEQRETLCPSLWLSAHWNWEPQETGVSPRVSRWEKKRTGAIVPAKAGACLPGIQVNSLTTCHHTLQETGADSDGPPQWVDFSYVSLLSSIICSSPDMATLTRTPFSAFHYFLLRLTGPWALTRNNSTVLPTKFH